MSVRRQVLRYRRHVSPPDVSKTSLYVWLDLAAKVLSAVALVALGLAGWLLQSSTQTQRDATDRIERQERRYLPMLRSLTELQLSLETTAAVARISQEPFYNAPSDYKDFHLRELGLRVRYSSLSVFAPDGPLIVAVRP